MFMVICMKFTLTVAMKGMRKECDSVEEFVKIYGMASGMVLSDFSFLFYDDVGRPPLHPARTSQGCWKALVNAN